MCMMNCDTYEGKVFLYRDKIRAAENIVRFHHRVDNSKDCFNSQIKQQSLGPVRDQMVNPLENLVWGNALVGDNSALAGETNGRYAEYPFKGWRYVSKTPEISHRIRVCLHFDQVEKQETWDAALQMLSTCRRTLQTMWYYPDYVDLPQPTQATVAYLERGNQPKIKTVERQQEMLVPFPESATKVKPN